MLKPFALSASVLAFSSGDALAETTLSTGQWLASIYDPSENKVGNVTDLVIDSNGNVTAAIIGVSGGFLGANQKDVVIPFKELKVSTRDGRIPERVSDSTLVSVAGEKRVTAADGQ
jgi:hypothetical protein